MKKIIIGILTFLISFLLSTNFANANINLTVSPVRFEFSGDKGQTLTGSIKVFNNSPIGQEVYITTKNSKTMNDSGEPKFEEEIENPELYIASWIKFSQEKFKIEGNKVIDVPFSIKIPEIANPGGQYGAIFFNVKENGIAGEVSVIKRIGVLLLLKINGEVNSVGEIDNISIEGEKNNTSTNKIYSGNFPFLDKIKKKVLAFFDYSDLELSSASEDIVYDIEGEDFGVKFNIDFSNKGNVHIKPKGKIEISDNNLNETYKKIGKESIKDSGGTQLGEKIVDYVPINDDGGNILPNTKRRFSPEWKGFAYETLNIEGKKVIEFKSPREYFKERNKVDIGYLMPWQKISIKQEKKYLNAKINISYNDPLGKEVSFDSNKNFFVIYDKEYIGLNWIVIIISITIILIIGYYFFFILPKKRRKKEIEIEEKIKKKLEKEKHKS